MKTPLRHVALGAIASALLAASSPALAQDSTLARNLAATCANCHGTNGQARGEMVSLAGRPAEQLLTILAGYRSGAIPATIMHQIVKGYTEEQIKLIAAHFAAQKPAK